MVMKAYGKTVVRTVKSNFARFIAITAVVLLGTAFVSGLGALPPVYEDTISEYFVSSHGADFVVKAESETGFSDEQLSSISDTDGVEKTTAFTSFDTASEAVSADGYNARIYYAELNDDAVNPFVLTEGKKPENSSQVLVDRYTLENTGLKIGDSVLVLGAGPTGLCTMMCARLYRPAHILAVEPDPARRALALAQGWADEAVEPGPHAAEALKNWTDGRGADVVLEAAGGRDTFQTAWQLARPNATVTVVAMYEEPQVLPLPDMYGKNLTFKTGGVDACHCGEILELIAAGKLNAEPLITHTYPLEWVMEAYDLFEQKGDSVLKIAVQL